MKRTLDVVVGLVLALAVTPMILIAAVVTAVSLRAWPFFSQQRVGRDGRTFRFFKIRTLPKSTPAYADKYAVADARMPWFSRMLRERHLDELPQLWLVVAGRMSLVGPRPEMPQLHARMDPDFGRLRTSVRPGCTGLWQISEGSTGMIHEAPEFDRFYVQHVSVGFDLWILGRTLGLVLPGVRHRLVTMPELRRRLVDLEPVKAEGVGVGERVAAAAD